MVRSRALIHLMASKSGQSVLRPLFWLATVWLLSYTALALVYAPYDPELTGQRIAWDATQLAIPLNYLSGMTILTVVAMALYAYRIDHISGCKPLQAALLHVVLMAYFGFCLHMLIELSHYGVMAAFANVTLSLALPVIGPLLPGFRHGMSTLLAGEYTPVPMMITAMAQYVLSLFLWLEAFKAVIHLTRKITVRTRN